MTRPLTFREVITVLLEQGAIIYCFRCKHTITTGKDAEREHFLEKALGGDDSADNARISHKDCHAVITRGTGATTAGSSVGKAAKDKRIAKGKMAVNKPVLPDEPWPYCLDCEKAVDPRQPHRCPVAQAHKDERDRFRHTLQGPPMQSARRPWPKRKMRGRA